MSSNFVDIVSIIVSNQLKWTQINSNRFFDSDQIPINVYIMSTINSDQIPINVHIMSTIHSDQILTNMHFMCKDNSI